MSELKTKLQDIIEEISLVTDLFYQQKDQQGFEKLNQLLAEVSNLLENIYQWDQECHLLGEAQQEILNILKEAMQAMETKDTILLADILQYDLKEQFENILDKII